MTTRKAALIALRDKVRDGADLTYEDFSELNYDGTVGGEIHALNAYAGSLDAAVALLEAVLPGWDFSVHTAWVTICEASVSAHGKGSHQVKLDPMGQKRSDFTPARAFLLAILEALIAEEE